MTFKNSCPACDGTGEICKKCEYSKDYCVCTKQISGMHWNDFDPKPCGVCAGKGKV